MAWMTQAIPCVYLASCLQALDANLHVQAIFFYGRHVTSSWVGHEYQLKNKFSNPLLDVLMEVLFEAVDSVIHYRCDNVQLESFRQALPQHMLIWESQQPLWEALTYQSSTSSTLESFVFSLFGVNACVPSYQILLQFIPTTKNVEWFPWYYRRGPIRFNTLSVVTHLNSMWGFTGSQPMQWRHLQKISTLLGVKQTQVRYRITGIEEWCHHTKHIVSYLVNFLHKLWYDGSVFLLKYMTFPTAQIIPTFGSDGELSHLVDDCIISTITFKIEMLLQKL